MRGEPTGSDVEGRKSSQLTCHHPVSWKNPPLVRGKAKCCVGCRFHCSFRSQKHAIASLTPAESQAWGSHCLLQLGLCAQTNRARALWAAPAPVFPVSDTACPWGSWRAGKVLIDPQRDPLGRSGTQERADLPHGTSRAGLTSEGWETQRVWSWLRPWVPSSVLPGKASRPALAWMSLGHRCPHSHQQQMHHRRRLIRGTANSMGCTRKW